MHCFRTKRRKCRFDGVADVPAKCGVVVVQVLIKTAEPTSLYTKSPEPEKTKSYVSNVH